MSLFETSVTINCTPEEAYDFLIRPANHLLIAPPEMGLVFVDAPEVLTTGSRFKFKMQNLGRVQTLEHEVLFAERPRGFSERQKVGPLKAWDHTHLNEPAPGGGTLISDRIEFERPGGLIGLLATEERILETLEDSFFHRYKALKKILEQSA